MGSAFIGCALIASPDRSALADDASRPIVLGALADVTGNDAQVGVAFSTGVRIAVDEINRNGGLLNRQIEVKTADVHSDTTATVNEAKRLAFQEKVDIAIGPVFSAAAFASVPVFTEAKIFQITTGGTTQLTPAIGPYHFSFAPSAESQGIYLASSAIETLRLKAPAVLADDTALSKTAVTGLEARLQELHVKAVQFQEYAFHTDDMTPQLLSVRRSNPDGVVFFVNALDDLKKLITTLADIGWDPMVIGSPALVNSAPTVAKTVRPGAFDHFYGLGYRVFSFCSGDAPGNSAYAQFIAKIAAVSPDLAKSGLTLPATLYYSSVYVMKAAVEATGTTDGPKLAAWVEQNGSAIPNLFGALSPSRYSHFLLGPQAMAIIQHPDQLRAEDRLQMRLGC
jgi:ABC-type branched-subunit amino acid transport system substrate-binding protein